MAVKREASLLDGRTAIESGRSQLGSEEPIVTADLGIAGLGDAELLATDTSTSLYCAGQPALDRLVAVKVLHDEPASSAGRRFEHETRIAGQLSGHAGIVPLFGTGTTADGEPFLMMPFYRRGSVEQFITEHGPVAWREATFLLEPVAVTMAEVHGCGMAHNNIIPANIMLTDFLLPRVGELGFSRAIGDERGAGPASDVFGMGAVLRSLLIGAPTDTCPVAWADGSVGKPVSPKPIRDLVERAMSNDAQRQPPNAAAFVTELRRAVSEADRARSTSATPMTGSNRAGSNGDGSNSHSRSKTDEASAQAGETVPEKSSEPSGDARYILFLVGCIAAVILVMVAAALLTVS